MPSTGGASSTNSKKARIRTPRACDRCRIKKAKCDGFNPCSKCEALEVICMFTEKKKHREASYPPGYVDMLELQQSMLVFGLQKLYQMIEQGKGWTGLQPRKTEKGIPVVHDILRAIGAFQVASDISANFEHSSRSPQMSPSIRDISPTRTTSVASSSPEPQSKNASPRRLSIRTDLSSSCGDSPDPTPQLDFASIPVQTWQYTYPQPDSHSMDRVSGMENCHTWGLETSSETPMSRSSLLIDPYEGVSSRTGLGNTNSTVGQLHGTTASTSSFPTQILQPSPQRVGPWGCNNLEFQGRLYSAEEMSCDVLPILRETYEG